MSVISFLHRLNRTDKPILNLHPFTKKFLLVLFVIFAFFTAKTIIAQNVIIETQNAFKNGNNQESWLNNAMSSNMVTGINILAGEIPNQKVGYTEGDFQQPTSWIPSGAIGTMNHLTASLYNPPASGIQYMAQIKDNLLGKPAYAQTTGIGFKGLQPILPLWKAMRNIVYTISSFFFIIVGIMIMLRVKISQQSVITIQNAIPKMITTLILVTFSYAIAGLLIDFMYFVQAAGIYIIFQIKATSLNSDLDLLKNLTGWRTTFWHINHASWNQHVHQMWLLIPQTTTAVFIMLSAGIGYVLGAFSLGGLLGMGGGVAAIAAGIGAVLILLLIIIAFFIQIISLFFGLLKAYFGVLMSIIFAPIIIGCGAFPNSKVNFESWLKQFLSNLIVFPAVYLFLLFVNVMISLIAKSSQTDLWAPQVIAFGPETMNVIIGIAAFFIVAKIPTLIPQAVFGIKPSPWGQALSQNMTATFKNPVMQAPLRGLSDQQGHVANLKERDSVNNPYDARKKREAIRAGWIYNAMNVLTGQGLPRRK